MQIHIITHKHSYPVEAYLDKERAIARYLELRGEQSEYGIITMDIKDAPDEP